MTAAAAEDARKSFTVPNHMMLHSTAEDAARVLSFDGELGNPAEVSAWVNKRKEHPAYRIEYRVAALQTLLVWSWQLQRLEAAAE